MGPREGGKVGGRAPESSTAERCAALALWRGPIPAWRVGNARIRPFCGLACKPGAPRRLAGWLFEEGSGPGRRRRAGPLHEHTSTPNTHTHTRSVCLTRFLSHTLTRRRCARCCFQAEAGGVGNNVCRLPGRAPTQTPEEAPIPIPSRERPHPAAPSPPRGPSSYDQNAIYIPLKGTPPEEGEPPPPAVVKVVAKANAAKVAAAVRQVSRAGDTRPSRCPSLEGDGLAVAGLTRAWGIHCSTTLRRLLCPDESEPMACRKSNLQGM